MGPEIGPPTQNTAKEIQTLGDRMGLGKVVQETMSPLRSIVWAMLIPKAREGPVPKAAIPNSSNIQKGKCQQNGM